MAPYSSSSRRPGCEQGEVPVQEHHICNHWGLQAPLGDAGSPAPSRRWGKFCQERFLCTFLCREVLTHAGNVTKILCNTSLCPPSSQHFFSWSSANTIPLILPLPLSPADLGSSNQALPTSRKLQQKPRSLGGVCAVPADTDVGQVGKTQRHKPRGTFSWGQVF